MAKLSWVRSRLVSNMAAQLTTNDKQGRFELWQKEEISMIMLREQYQIVQPKIVIIEANAVSHVACTTNPTIVTAVIASAV